MRDAAIISWLGKLCYGKQAILVDNRRLRSGASEWRTFAQEKLQVIRRFCIAVHRIGCIEERRQMNKGRYAVAPDVMTEIRISFSLVPQGADPGLIVDSQQAIDFRKCTGPPRFSSSTPDEKLPPPIW